MNKTVANLSVRGAFARILSISFLVALLGGVIGVTTVDAETRSNLYVDGYGNVLTAGTTGYWQGSTLVAFGASSTTTFVYYLKADARIWHDEGGTKRIVSEATKDCYNCTSASTDSVSSLVYDARAATQSHAHASWNWGNSYYTSFPDNSVSCYTYWSSGNNC